MPLYSENKEYILYCGEMQNELENLADNSIDSIVCDPPYELNFMNKGWDNSGVAFRKETWEKCYRVLKHGGYLLAFGGSRTFHRIACAIEDAGFEIRDTIMWIYGSGFPKSMNIGKAVESKMVNGSANTQDFKKLKGTMVKSGDWGLNSNNYEYGARPSDYSADKHLRLDKVDYQTEEGARWNGWGTCLKPSYEPIIVARKPCDGGCVDNVLKWGVGAINIDECRIDHDEEQKYTNRKPKSGSVFNTETSGYDNTENHNASANEKGRFPANTILTYDETDYEEVCGGFPHTKSTGGSGEASKKNQFANVYNDGWAGAQDFAHLGGLGDEGSASRYFYCAKASKKDRDEGLDGFETKQCVGGGGGIGDYLEDVNSCSGKFGSEKAPHKNTHPTVKPTSLMQYLIRLVSPKGATVLDPFMGSGSTGKACMIENNERNAGYRFIGIEMTSEYLPIAEARIRYWLVCKEQEEAEARGKQGEQISLFDIANEKGE